MPCHDGGPSPLEEEAMNVSAFLCGIVRTLTDQHALNNVLDAVNWKEAGIERYQFEKWWHAHKLKDDARLLHEAEQKRFAAIRLRAEAKLTPEELSAIRHGRF